jgi:hypothetical protein
MATAGAVTATALAATIALGANLGLFGLASAENGPGNLSVVDKTKAVRTEVIDIPVPVTTPSTAPSRSSRTVPATPTVSAPSRSHDDESDDDEHEEVEHEDAEHEEEDD